MNPTVSATTRRLDPELFEAREISTQSEKIHTILFTAIAVEPHPMKRSAIAI
jgi:hypothetical protein